MPTFEEIKNSIEPLIGEYGIKKVGIFGSTTKKDIPGLKIQIKNILDRETDN